MEFIVDEEFRRMTLSSILKQSIAIPKSSPKTFCLMTLVFILPLSLMISFYPFIIYSTIESIHLYLSSTAQSQYRQFLLLLYNFLYLLLIFIDSLIATSSSVFAVASLYTSNHITFTSTVYAVPRIFPRVFITFLWITLFMVMYISISLFCAPIILVALSEKSGIAVCIVILIPIFLTFIWVHLCAVSVWHVASVVSVLEPVYGREAVRKSHALLQGKRSYAMVLVLVYMLLAGAISWAFDKVVMRGQDMGIVVYWRIFIGVALVGLLAGLTWLGLIAQSVFHFVCKSFHQGRIDKNVLVNLLGWYVRVHVKLNCMV